VVKFNTLGIITWVLWFVKSKFFVDPIFITEKEPNFTTRQELTRTKKKIKEFLLSIALFCLR